MNSVMRILAGLLLPLLAALPAWWGLHLESTTLEQASVLVKADIAEMAPAEALASTFLQLRAEVWERDLTLDELEKERGRPILWLHALGTLPDGVTLESAELTQNRWVIRGQTADDQLRTLQQRLTSAGLQVEVPALGADSESISRFTLSGTMTGAFEDTAP